MWGARRPLPRPALEPHVPSQGRGWLERRVTGGAGSRSVRGIVGPRGSEGPKPRRCWSEPRGRRPKAPCGCAGDACQSRPGEKHSHSSPELSAPAVRRTGCKGRRAQPHSLDTLGAEEEGASEGRGRTAHPAALWAPTQERSRAASGAEWPERTAAAPGLSTAAILPPQSFSGDGFLFLFFSWSSHG